MNVEMWAFWAHSVIPAFLRRSTNFVAVHVIIKYADDTITCWPTQLSWHLPGIW